jgi:predicted phage-related endonuclease
MTLPVETARIYAGPHRRSFIGGSDARIIMGTDEAALVRLWREKRGEAEPADYSDNLIVQLGVATEPLNRRWFEKTTGGVLRDVQRWIGHPVIRWMAATLDGIVEGSGAVFEAKFMLPWLFSEEAAAEKHMAQVQHNMWVANATGAVLSIITGGGKWVEIKLSALRIVDMNSSNAWAEFSSVFRRTRDAHLEHEKAKTELKGLIPEDAKEAAGHGVRAKRSKSGAVSFDLLGMEGASHAPFQ